MTQAMAKFVVLAVLWFTVCSLASGTVFKLSDVTTESSNEVLHAKWDILLDNVKTISDTVMKQALPMIIRFTSEVDISSDCQASLLKMAFALRNGKLWALKMIDAMGKPFAGVTLGTGSDLGAYDGCLDIEVRDQHSENFQGQYCLLDLRPPLPKQPKHYYFDETLDAFKNYSSHQNEAVQDILRRAGVFFQFAFRLGLCVPSTCSREDIQKAAAYGAQQLEMNADVQGCEIKGDWSFNTAQFVVVCIFCVFGLIIFLGTAFDITYDMWWMSNTERNEDETKNITDRGTLKVILEACSLRRSLPSLFSTRRNPKALGFMEGIKVFAMSGIVIVHVYSSPEHQVLRFPNIITKDLSLFLLQPIINGRIHVDTFVFMTATIFSSIFVSVVGKKAITAPMYAVLIIRRIWRLQPMVLVVLGWLILLPLMGSGPIWHETIDAIVDNCHRNWLNLITFTNNFVPLQQVCLTTTWYVSLDMQLFFVFLIYTFLYVKWRALAYFFLVLLLVASIVPIAVLTFLDNRAYPPILSIRTGARELIEATDTTGNKLYLHLGVYAIGLATGTLIATKEKLQINWKVQLFTWIVFIGSSGAVWFGTIFWNGGAKPEPLESALYAGTFRMIWAAGLSWISLACYYGYGGYLNRFLCWNFFIPLGRLTYIIFLVHLPILHAYNASTWGTIDFRHTVLAFIAMGLAISSLAFSIMLYVFFECPLKLVDQLVFGRCLARIGKQNAKESLPQNVTKM